MLVFDQLKKDDPQLRVVAVMVLGGLGILLAGLWWVQIVSSRDYRESLETQSFRTVRIPAVRGKILDRDGNVLAENRPIYNVSLYLEELRRPFDSAYSNAVVQALNAQLAEEERSLGRKLTKQERKKVRLSVPQKDLLRQKARYTVASNVVMQVSLGLQQPKTLNPTNFERHYQTRLALPFTVVHDLDPTNIARFEEQMAGPTGVDLEVQSTRYYPYQSAAAHLLGSVKRDDSSAEGEEAFFSYRLQDFRGVLGIEYGYDRELRGMAGAKSVQVNNVGYRTTGNLWTPAEPGKNVVLTIDLEVQKAAERALQSVYGPTTRGAVVVMDVTTGDVLALVSSPTINPNDPVEGFPPGELQRRRDEKLRPELNRATQGAYFPGSIFKTVVGLAALEAGLNPEETFSFPSNPREPGKAYIVVHGRTVRDTANAGTYNFRRAIVVSSNSYFVTNGLRCGPEKIIRLGQRFHLGERIGLSLNQESGGSLPALRRLSSGWTDGNTANLSIGQDPVTVTPLQVAVMISAIANGGTVFYPRLVERVEPQSQASGEPPLMFPDSQVRDHLGVSPRSLKILHDAMLAETEDAEGTGREAAVPGFQVCGKTGTAQIQDVNGNKTGQTTWFASFAPYGNPRYAVVVMVEDGASGGKTCSPVAGKVYTALLQRQQQGRNGTLANRN